MFLPKTYILFILLVLGVSTCVAQGRKSVRSTGYKVHQVSRSHARIMCPIFAESQYPYQSIGVKMGDPFAVTYKYYPSKHWAFAADAGRAASGLYNKYYRGLFKTYLPDTLTGEQSIQYLAHRAPKDLFVEAKFLYQWNADKISKGLQFYVGAGWQWRNSGLEYDYSFSESNDPGSDGSFGSFPQKRFTYGPTILTGLEYSYFSIPLSAFIEIEWFTDVLLDPGYQRFQGGLGLRYVF
jgi:hypothetical protein